MLSHACSMAEVAGGWSMRTQQAVYLTVVFCLPLLAVAPGLRTWVVTRPRWVLAALLLVDLAFMLWLTIPYVPLGVDETFFDINAHVYAGNDQLWLCWNRPPMASLGALVCPWHPPLVGLLLRSATAWLAFALAERAVRAPWALAAPLLVLVGSQMTLFSAALMSEPYGAVCVAGFALLAARGVGGGAAAGAVAGLAFLSRWPLGWLLPVAMFVGHRRQGWRGVLLAFVAFAGPVVAVVYATDTRPWLMLADRGEWKQSSWATLLYFLRPDVAFGVGWSHLVLLVVGAFGARDAAIRWCVFLFAACAAALVVTGEATMRLMTPVVPVVAVVVARGLQRTGEWGARRWRWPAFAGALLTGLVAVSVAFPVRPLRNHALALTSLQNLVRQHRAELSQLIGTEPLYTDCNFIAMTAVLNHRCHAVLRPEAAGEDPRRGHPEGVGLDLGGTTPPCDREHLPPGTLYLTFDPAGHRVLWHEGELFLVRW
ncbi:MAG TPA: hypothetical protein VFZ65_19140 [Planctomycetota bacterium]|nr:hypothetical protein [Planctomycetota bacterium]